MSQIFILKSKRGRLGQYSTIWGRSLTRPPRGCQCVKWGSRAPEEALQQFHSFSLVGFFLCQFSKHGDGDRILSILQTRKQAQRGEGTSPRHHRSKREREVLPLSSDPSYCCSFSHMVPSGDCRPPPRMFPRGRRQYHNVLSLETDCHVPGWNDHKGRGHFSVTPMAGPA